MDVLAERRQLGVGADHVLAHVLRVRARVADAVDPVDRVDRGEQVGEADPRLLRQVAPVGVDVLAQQRHLAHAVGRQALDLGDQLAPAARLSSRPRVEGTMQYEQAQLQPCEICSQAWNSRSRLCGQVPREVLELEVALRGQRVGGEELGEPVDLARAEGDVDEREALEDLVLDRLGPAAADADDALGVLGLQPLGLAEVGDEPVVGRSRGSSRC